MKVGDKVVLKSMTECKRLDNDAEMRLQVGVNCDMNQYFGTEVTISSIVSEARGRFRIKEDDGSWIWVESWVEPSKVRKVESPKKVEFSFENTKKELIKNAGRGGKIFTVDFFKKDGSFRTMNCRLGVTKYLKGAKARVTTSKYMTVYDVHAKGYRMINLETVSRIAGAGKQITFQ